MKTCQGRETSPKTGNDRFWEKKSLKDMTKEEWELLCDGCAVCCLHKVEYEDSGEVFYTAVACRLLDIAQCRCTAYADRFSLMPDCLHLTPETVNQYSWLPETCAYRLLSEGKDLPEWHPLISGDPESIHSSGISLRDRAISEQYVSTDDLEAYILRDFRFLPSSGSLPKSGRNL
ncbi:MAG: YcgN family cysteine cluster protein [Desulfobacterales bacterium]